MRFAGASALRRSSQQQVMEETMDLVNLATWAALGTLPAFLVLDLVYRARRFQTPRFWRLRAFVVSALMFMLSLVLPAWWGRLFGEYTLLSLASLGTWGGAAVGILVYQFAHYWYHRSVHRSDLLWRTFHQMHHSAESLDAWGAYYLSPTDAAMFISIGTIVFGPLLGLSVAAAALANLYLTVAAVLQHANIRTPRWVGYFIQRPESHGIHHQRGVHAFNYADLPLWDMLFGTFRNPATFDGEIGFYDGASSRIGEMLIGRDVSVKPEEDQALAQVA
jgi:sterol desaturase/sphingolipid hydroxylase (fatty acid hydroxylase superfamily)